MNADPDVRCPVCDGTEWRQGLSGPSFVIRVCVRGCIGRTDPTPPPEDARAPVDGFTDTEADARASDLFYFAERLMDRVRRLKTGGRLLDIGCGCGHVVRAALDSGFDAIGLEVSPLGVAYARQVLGLEPVSASFPEHRFEAESFDVVVLKHVLEHVGDPNQVLNEVHRILRPGGIAVVESPNFRSLMSRIKGAGWPGIQAHEHVWQLSPGAVRALLKRAGLAPVYARTEALEYYRGDGSLPKWLALRTLLGIAQLLRSGDNLTAIAERGPRP